MWCTYVRDQGQGERLPTNPNSPDSGRPYEGWNAQRIRKRERERVSRQSWALRLCASSVEFSGTWIDRKESETRPTVGQLLAQRALLILYTGVSSFDRESGCIVILYLVVVRIMPPETLSPGGTKPSNS